VSAFSERWLFKEPRGLLANGLAASYALGGYAGGFALMAGKSWLWAACGVLLCAHAMFIAAYLLHEACHDAVFVKHSHNRRFGELMSFVAGGAYASYERIRELHVRHHRERRDVTCFDHRALLQRAPRWALRLVLALEWAHLPAVESLMHLQVVLRPFLVREQRRYLGRVLLMLAVRGALLTALALLAPRALPLYLLAYGLLLTWLGFFDAFHHSYELWLVGGPEPSGARPSREYERANTYSNVFSLKHPWLNVLALNFGFHNAHHERAGTPWYRLPALHRELCHDSPQVLPVRELLRTFHVNRVRRVLDADYGAVGQGRGRADGFVGAHGVSFLTVV
jgi:fatty acid desaturase